MRPESGYCNVPCIHGGTCTLDYDHAGHHEAHGLGGAVLCTWPRDDFDENIRETDYESLVRSLENIVNYLAR